MMCSRTLVWWRPELAKKMLLEVARTWLTPGVKTIYYVDFDKTLEKRFLLILFQKGRFVFSICALTRDSTNIYQIGDFSNSVLDEKWEFDSMLTIMGRLAAPISI